MEALEHSVGYPTRGAMRNQVEEIASRHPGALQKVERLGRLTPDRRAQCKGTTVVLTDVHLGCPDLTRSGVGWLRRKKLRELLESLGERPLVERVIFTGDLVDFWRDDPIRGFVELSSIAGQLRALRAKQVEVWWVPGNHDHRIHDATCGRRKLLDLAKKLEADREPPDAPGAVALFTSRLEQALYEDDPLKVLWLFVQRPWTDPGTVTHRVLDILLEARAYRHALEEQTGCRVAYPYLELERVGRGDGERRECIFVTHGDVVDFMRGFDKLARPCEDTPKGWRRRVALACRWLLGLQPPPWRTGVFGFFDWIYTETEESIDQFEQFAHQRPDTLMRRIGLFVRSDFAVGTFGRACRCQLRALGWAGAVLAPMLLGHRSKWARWVFAPGARALRRFLPGAAGPIVAALSAAALLLAATLGLLWLGVRFFGTPNTAGLILSVVSIFLALAPLTGLALMGVAGALVGLLLIERFSVLTPESLDDKEEAVRLALREGWFGDEARTAHVNGGYAHLVFGHCHGPESSGGATDVGAWISEGTFYVGVPGQPGSGFRTLPMRTYAEIADGRISLHNYEGPGKSLTFQGYGVLPSGERVPYWQ